MDEPNRSMRRAKRIAIAAMICCSSHHVLADGADSIQRSQAGVTSDWASHAQPSTLASLLAHGPSGTTHPVVQRATVAREPAAPMPSSIAEILKQSKPQIPQPDDAKFRSPDDPDATPVVNRLGVKESKDALTSLAETSVANAQAASEEAGKRVVAQQSSGSGFVLQRLIVKPVAAKVAATNGSNASNPFPLPARPEPPRPKPPRPEPPRPATDAAAEIAREAELDYQFARQTFQMLDSGLAEPAPTAKPPVVDQPTAKQAAAKQAAAKQAAAREPVTNRPVTNNRPVMNGRRPSYAVSNPPAVQKAIADQANTVQAMTGQAMTGQPNTDSPLPAQVDRESVPQITSQDDGTASIASQSSAAPVDNDVAMMVMPPTAIPALDRTSDTATALPLARRTGVSVLAHSELISERSALSTDVRFPSPVVPGQSFGMHSAGASALGDANRLREMAHIALQDAKQSLQRGATHSARKHATEALRHTVNMHDAREGGNLHAKHLQTALDAIRESADFCGRFGSVDSRSMQRMVAVHATTVLKQQDVSRISSIRATEAYLDVAREHLVSAAGESVEACDALIMLGIVEKNVAESGDSHAGAVAITLQRSAIEVSPGSAVGYRELGKTYLEQGLGAQAAWSLRESVRLRPSRSAYQGLLEASRRMGDADTARQCVAALNDPDLPSGIAVKTLRPEAFAASYHPSPAAIQTISQRSSAANQQAADLKDADPSSASDSDPAATKDDRVTARSIFSFGRRK
ncbi:hypothetical protein K227x_06800 [Rubripirellula lacrimiformis]|uniref:Tetratricopeptide repeat protein n=1 Tax=Rubripirellula lacrimiformis TaxID=1930273 RepID=A0A517N5B2_9BACT|nr:hypothetical protein [Rubripirellula lacrimiformis]QDT02304.1 hypothetical protein K227x_06800 [Rubripirellula lacrimiformis]